MRRWIHNCQRAVSMPSIKAQCRGIKQLSIEIRSILPKVYAKLAKNACPRLREPAGTSSGSQEKTVLDTSVRSRQMGGRSSSLPEPIKIERAGKVMEHNRVDRSVMLLLLLQVPPTMRWSGRMASYGLWRGMDVCKASFPLSTKTHLIPLWLRWTVLLHGCTKYSLDSDLWPCSKVIARIASFVHWYASEFEVSSTVFYNKVFLHSREPTS